MWSSIISQLLQHQRFIISSHLNPDCDALGSELALAYHLTNLGKEVAIFNADPYPDTYRFLDPDRLIQTFSENSHGAAIMQTDVIIVVDASGGWQRLGRVGEILSQVDAVTICIDHHPNTEPFTHFSRIDPGVVATAELIYDLIMAMKGQITRPIAEAIYTAIITDSGSFRFSKTSPHTHRIAAHLLECGVDPTAIHSLLYEQYPLSRVRLKGYVLQNIALHARGQIACISLSIKTLQEFNVSSSDLDGFSSLPQQVGAVKISILLVELPRERVKISLRSDGSVPVNGLAAHFGGGGHAPAAGAVVKGRLEEISGAVISEAEKLLANAAP